ncbi:MAG: DNA-directed RNA polymerase subunit L [Methanoculleaceae archaeon]
MELKVLELEDRRARLLFPGQTHTFMNLLVDEILCDERVEIATYNMEFEFSDPELKVTTTGGRHPLDAITEAARRIAGRCDELIALLEERE